jgi:hypothetical protein
MLMGRSLAFALLSVAGATVPAPAKIHPADRAAGFVYVHSELSGQTTAGNAERISLPLADGADSTNLTAQIAQHRRYRLEPRVRRVALDVQSVTQAQPILVRELPQRVA